MQISPLIQRFVAFIFTFCLAPAAFAQESHPVPGVKEWQMGMRDAASPVMDRLHHFHDFLLVIIVAISIFVLALLAYICWRFNEKANPTPSKTTHHTMLEVIWTLVPVVILVAIAIPSLRHLYYMDRVEGDADMTLKVVGYQWYWNYEYPDYGFS
ncbi:MAG: cytochrome c oxidase subunit II transmembrane domain-containing protein, partial [Rickettsiales bacterium]